jgi:hypothetical protein
VNIILKDFTLDLRRTMMPKTRVNIENLCREYDVARTSAKVAAATAVELADAIKTLLGDTTEAETPTYVCTYKFDKDRTTEVFDAEKFEQKDAKGFAKYTAALDTAATLAKKFTKTTVVQGARKLYVTLKNRGEN